MDLYSRTPCDQLSLDGAYQKKWGTPLRNFGASVTVHAPQSETCASHELPYIFTIFISNFWCYSNFVRLPKAPPLLLSPAHFLGKVSLAREKTKKQIFATNFQLFSDAIVAEEPNKFYPTPSFLYSSCLRNNCGIQIPLKGFHREGRDGVYRWFPELKSMVCHSDND